MEPVVFHIISKSDWANAKDEVDYSPASFASEGFIHLSQKSQILRPANLLYNGEDDLLLLVLAVDELGPELRYEPGSHGESELFPHLYGELNVSAVVDVVEFPCQADGSFVLPQLPG